MALNCGTFFPCRNFASSCARLTDSPGVLQSVLTAQPFVDVDAHEATDELLGLGTDVVPIRRVEFEFAFQNLGEEIGVVLVVEGRIAAQQDIADHADRPDVDGLAVGLLGQHLRRHVTGRSASRGHDPGILHFGQTKVADHDLGVFLLVLIKQIFRFQISVHDAFAVHVSHGVQDLLDKVGRVLLRVRALFHDAVEQLAAGHSVKYKNVQTFSPLNVNRSRNNNTLLVTYSTYVRKG